VNGDSLHWSQKLYETKAAELILYGRALGLSHAEAEDVLQEAFVAFMQLPQAPAKPWIAISGPTNRTNLT